MWFKGIDRIKKQLHEGKIDYLSRPFYKIFDSIESGFFGDTKVIHPIIDRLSDDGDEYITWFDLNFLPWCSNQSWCCL